MTDWRLAERSRRAYEYDWRGFSAWCEQQNLTALPASSDTARLFLEAMAEGGRRCSSLGRYASGINHHHREAGLSKPVTTEIRAWIAAKRRASGEVFTQKDPLTVDILRRMCRGCSKRDRAILTVGFASALRSANLAALRTEDIRIVPQGAILSIHREKQDRRAQGRVVGIARGHKGTCPVTALQSWLEARGNLPGSVFLLKARTICAIVKRHVRRIGLDPRRYGAHSLRAGFVTAALNNGVNELKIAEHTGHRSLASLRLYYRNRDPFLGQNASALVGL